MRNLYGQNMKRTVRYSFALTLICAFLFAISALASEFPMMPMIMNGVINDKDGKPVGEGTVKVSVGDKQVFEQGFNSGKFDVGIDPMDDTNKNELTRSDIGSPVKFSIVVAGKEYAAQIVSPPELLFQEGAVINDINLKIDYSGGTSQAGGGGSGGGATNQDPTAPSASPGAGNYTGSVKVTLSSTTDSAVIYFTTDNTDPKNSPSRKEYTAPVEITINTTIKAVSNKDNLYSEVKVFEYVINKAAESPDSAGVTLVDIKNHWAAVVIQKMVEGGIVSGYEDKTFRPDNSINRLECAAIIMRAMALGETDTQNLTDFNDAGSIPVWGQKSVSACVAAGYLAGYPATDNKKEFKPLNKITRVELAAILSRVITQKLGDQQAQGVNFKDKENIPSWADNAVAVAVQTGLIKGYPDGTFQPQKDVSRAEAVAMLDRLLEAVKGK